MCASDGQHLDTQNLRSESPIHRCAEESLDNVSDGANRLVDRLEDLLPITRKHYYHPDMKGSWSIKSVLPTVASILIKELSKTSLMGRQLRGPILR